MSKLNLGKLPRKEEIDAFWDEATKTTDEKVSPEQKAAYGLMGLRTINCKGDPQRLEEFDAMVSKERSKGRTFREIYEDVENATFENEDKE